MIPLGSGALIQCCMEPDVGRVPKFEVWLFPFYNFKCLTGRGNRKCNFVWEVLNFAHIWGTENFRFPKQTLWFQWDSGNRKSSSRCRSINVAAKSQANLNLRSIQKFQVFKYAGGSQKCKTLRLRFFLRSLAYIAVTKVDNVDGQTKSKRWVINGCAARISRDSKKLFGKRDGVAGEGLPHVRVASLKIVFPKCYSRRR